MIDIHEDRRQLEMWLSADTEDAWQDLGELLYFAIHGIKSCDDFCGSRETFGEDQCFCIRARFSSNEHYFLYLELRKLAKKLASFALIAETTQEANAQTKEHI